MDDHIYDPLVVPFFFLVAICSGRVAYVCVWYLYKTSNQEMDRQRERDLGSIPGLSMSMPCAHCGGKSLSNPLYSI